MYIFNGQDALSYYDGSTITVYTEINPPTGLAVAAQGTTGSTAYSYRVSAINAVGESLASTAVAIANGNQTLSATNYNKLTWDTVSGAVSYNIYGRKATGLTETYMATVSELVYNDTGDDIPSQFSLPQLTQLLVSSVQWEFLLSYFLLLVIHLPITFILWWNW